MGESAKRDTLGTLFPGLEGRMQLVRVMLALRMPELRDQPKDEPLDEELATKLREARSRVLNG